MSSSDLSRSAAREVLTDRERWSSWLGGRTLVEIRFDASRDVWTVTSAPADAEGTDDAMVIGVETEQLFSRCWSVADMPTAIRVAGAFARDPDDSGRDQSDLDAIEEFERSPEALAFVSIFSASAPKASLAAMFLGHPACEPKDLPDTVELRPMDLFDKFGFDDGEALDAHVQRLRSEGWCLGADELLRAIVEAKVLPLLDPRPSLDRIISLHNNVRGLIEGRGEELEDEDFDFLPSATAAWPASIAVSTADILEHGREVAGPLTRRIRALETAFHG